MTDEKTVIDQTVKGQEGETSLIDDLTQIDEANKGNVIKEEEKVNPYEVKLKEVEAEIAKQKEIIEHKNRAINALKKKKPQVEEEIGDEEDEEETKPELDKGYVDSKYEQLAVDIKSKEITADEAERKLILYHYNNSIKKTGDMDRDLKLSRAIANEHIIEQVQKNRQEAEAKENELVNFSSGNPRREISGEVARSAVNSAAAAFLDKIDPEAKKYL